jgi:hypothetical protein
MRPRLNAGKDLAAVLQALEISEATLTRGRAQYGGMKSEEAKRLKALEEENQRQCTGLPERPRSATRAAEASTTPRKPPCNPVC